MNTSPKPVRDMDEAEFAEALRTRAWRDTAGRTDAPPTRKPALDLTEAQFANALRIRSWRTPK